MSRKRSKYRPRPIIHNTMEYVRFSVARAGSNTAAARDLKLELHEALDSLRCNDYPVEAVSIVNGALHVGQRLATQGIGHSHLPKFEAAIQALKRYTGDPAQAELITAAVVAHDAQIETATVAEIDAAVRYVDRNYK